MKETIKKTILDLLDKSKTRIEIVNELKNSNTKVKTINWYYYKLKKEKENGIDK